MKAGRIGSEETELQHISSYVLDQMKPDTLYIMGPGTTMREVKNRIDLENTLLGVDVVENGKIVARDAGEQTLLRLIEGKPARIIVVATKMKIAALAGRPLLVDTGDEETDRLLSGYIRVVGGFGEQFMFRVSA